MCVCVCVFSLFAVFQVREAEIRIDATIGPVEESFALLNKHQLSFSDGSAERVDGLSYTWKNLNALVHKHPANMKHTMERYMDNSPHNKLHLLIRRTPSDSDALTCVNLFCSSREHNL